MATGVRLATGAVITMVITTVTPGVTGPAIMPATGRIMAGPHPTIITGTLLPTMFTKTVLRVWRGQGIHITILKPVTGSPHPTGQGHRPSPPTGITMFTPTAAGMFTERTGITGTGWITVPADRQQGSQGHLPGNSPQQGSQGHLPGNSPPQGSQGHPPGNNPPQGSQGHPPGNNPPQGSQGHPPDSRPTHTTALKVHPIRN